MEDSLENKESFKKCIRNYLILIVMCLSCYFAKAQDVRFAAYGLVDPVATVKDGHNFGLGIEYQMTVVYFKAEVFAFPELRGTSYYHLQGTVLGFNKHLFNKSIRVYGGGKLGFIKRDEYTYPTYGFESGIDYYPCKTFSGAYIGLVLSKDWREDFLFSGAEPAFRDNGGIRIGLTF